MTAEYIVSNPKGFFASPNLIPRGARIAFAGPPGPGLEPANAEAVDAFERWFHEEWPEYDEKGRKTGQMIKPHLRYKIEKYEPGVAYTATVLAPPPRELPGTLDLSTVNLRAPTEDVRPPPIIGPVEQFDEAASALTVLEAPPPKKEGK